MKIEYTWLKSDANITTQLEVNSLSKTNIKHDSWNKGEFQMPRNIGIHSKVYVLKIDQRLFLLKYVC